MSKKFFIIMLWALSMAMAFAISCTSDVSDNVNTSSKENKDLELAYTELIQNLTDYNSSFEQTVSIPQTRGKFWRKIRGFLLADAGSFFLGAASPVPGLGLFTAIFGSATCGPVFTETLGERINIDDETGTETSVIPNDTAISEQGPIGDSTGIEEAGAPGEGDYGTVSIYDFTVNSNMYATSSGVGYLHNCVLADLEQDNPGIYNTKTGLSSLASLISDEMLKYGYDISDEERNICLQKIQFLLNDSAELNEEDDLILLFKRHFPEYSSELTVLNDFVVNVESLVGSSEDIISYLTGYIQIILQSNLPSAEKQLLQNSIEIAANSAVLWNVEEK